MTNKQFWQRASNWGLICGGALFVMNLIGWALKLETTSTWLYELLLFIVICPVIVYTGRKNAQLAGPEGYSYGRAVGFVFAMMLFAGIVYGVGRFLIVNFIARDYYDALNAQTMETALAVYRNTPMYDQMLGMRDMMVGMMANPFILIINGIWGLVIKGGFLGLILCAFLKKNPDIFAAAPAQPALEQDEPKNE